LRSLEDGTPVIGVGENVVGKSLGALGESVVVEVLDIEEELFVGWGLVNDGVEEVVGKRDGLQLFE
jgi:hypothetical protein